MVRGQDPKVSKLLRFTSAVTSVVAEPRGKWLLAGTQLAFKRRSTPCTETEPMTMSFSWCFQCFSSLFCGVQWFSMVFNGFWGQERGIFLSRGTDSGCVHAVIADPWPEAQVVDTNRISDVGIAKLCITTSEESIEFAFIRSQCRYMHIICTLHIIY